VYSGMDYSHAVTSVLAGLPAGLLGRLQSVLNEAARLTDPGILRRHY